MWASNFKRNIYLFFGFIILLGNTSCEKLLIEKDKAPTNHELFDEFWTLLDERYALFMIKDIIWDDVYIRYEPQITEQLSEFQMIDIFGKIIQELKDSHTDLKVNNTVKYYWPLSAGYMENFSFKVISQFYINRETLKTNNSVSYGKIFESGYIYIKDFKEEISESTVSEIITEMEDTKNLIIDIRNNTGGNESYGNFIVGYFIDKSFTNKIIKFKNGKAHNSFLAINSTVNPSSGPKYKNKIVVLTNKATFSAANSFTNSLSMLPQVTLIGDTTGGGGSLPLNYEFSNGWVLRYSSSIEYRPSDNLIIDKGIPPTYYVEKYRDSKKDNVLDFALEYLNSN
jgi:hypothetical protein